MDYKQIIDKVYNEVSGEPDLGQVASYIPELLNVDAEKFGISLITTDNKIFSTGDYSEKFSIQSVVKVFSLCLAYAAHGKELWKRVGVEPSGTPFNSLVQLEHDCGIPRNPFINSGAVVICDILMDMMPHPKSNFLDFIRKISGSNEVDYCHKTAESEKKHGFRNLALANFIRSFGNIKNPVDKVLDFYYSICSIKMNCSELARSFMFLANDGQKLGASDNIISRSQAKRINSIMLTCGFYDEAGEFAYRVGLPGKSGVGGGIAAVLPEKFSIAVWSPGLNKKGNSYRGMKFLERFTTETELSVF